MDINAAAGELQRGLSYLPSHGDTVWFYGDERPALVLVCHSGSRQIVVSFEGWDGERILCTRDDLSGCSPTHENWQRWMGRKP